MAGRAPGQRGEPEVRGAPDAGLRRAAGAPDRVRRPGRHEAGVGLSVPAAWPMAANWTTCPCWGPPVEARARPACHRGIGIPAMAGQNAPGAQAPPQKPADRRLPTRAAGPEASPTGGARAVPSDPHTRAWPATSRGGQARRRRGSRRELEGLEWSRRVPSLGIAFRALSPASPLLAQPAQPSESGPDERVIPAPARRPQPTAGGCRESPETQDRAVPPPRGGGPRRPIVRAASPGFAPLTPARAPTEGRASRRRFRLRQHPLGPHRTPAGEGGRRGCPSPCATLQSCSGSRRRGPHRLGWRSDSRVPTHAPILASRVCRAHHGLDGHAGRRVRRGGAETHPPPPARLPKPR